MSESCTVHPRSCCDTNNMLPSMKQGGRQSKIQLFMPKVSSEEWQQRMEQEKERMEHDPSVQIMPAPSVQIVPPSAFLKRRRPGRPRKVRQLFVDLTSSGTPPAHNSSQEQKTSTPQSGGTSRTDWTHPALFLQIIK